MADAAAPSPAAVPIALAGILETSLYADDLDLALSFYRDVLGLSLVGRAAGRHVFLRCGRQMLLIFNPDATRAGPSAGPASAPAHGARGPGHVAFAASDTALDAWRARLAGLGVPIETEIAWPHGGRSLYFRDPAGNSLEITSPQIWGLPDPRG
jgi:catechol 2,3-dioxygenase-like lactoylglutathione lyase family enzyme